MYQAIHTVVINPIGNSSKIAISTRVMNDLYNFGIANKWQYDLTLCRYQVNCDICSIFMSAGIAQSALSPFRVLFSGFPSLFKRTVY